jgi:hypothetical protein
MTLKLKSEHQIEVNKGKGVGRRRCHQTFAEETESKGPKLERAQPPGEAERSSEWMVPRMHCIYIKQNACKNCSKALLFSIIYPTPREKFLD